MPVKTKQVEVEVYACDFCGDEYTNKFETRICGDEVTCDTCHRKNLRESAAAGKIVDALGKALGERCQVVKPGDESPRFLIRYQQIEVCFFSDGRLEWIYLGKILGRQRVEMLEDSDGMESLRVLLNALEAEGLL